MDSYLDSVLFISSRRRHTRCALVTGVQTCALPISAYLGRLLLTEPHEQRGITGDPGGAALDQQRLAAGILEMVPRGGHPRPCGLAVGIDAEGEPPAGDPDPVRRSHPACVHARDDEFGFPVAPAFRMWNDYRRRRGGRSRRRTQTEGAVSGGGGDARVPPAESGTAACRD